MLADVLIAAGVLWLACAGVFLYLVWQAPYEHEPPRPSGYRRLRAWLFWRLWGDRAWAWVQGGPDPILTLAMIEYLVLQSSTDQWTVRRWLVDLSDDEKSMIIDSPALLAAQPLAVQRFIAFCDSRPAEDS